MPRVNGVPGLAYSARDPACAATAVGKFRFDISSIPSLSFIDRIVFPVALSVLPRSFP